MRAEGGSEKRGGKLNSMRLVQQSTDRRAILMVQEICCYWTKSSRGGEGAVVRNSLPDRLSLPLHLLSLSQSDIDDLRVLYHTVGYYEREGFQNPTEEIFINPTACPRHGCTTIDCSLLGIQLRYYHDMGKGGAPQRGWGPRTVQASIDMWAQVKENGRFSWEETWAYQKVVLNVGMFTTLTADCFHNQPPIAMIDAMAELR